MTKTVGTIGTLLAIVLLTAGCSLLDLFGGPRLAEVALSEADNGRVIGLVHGQFLIIKLEANPSTGYTWETAELNRNILQQMGAAEFKSDNPGLAGAPGREIFRFKAANVGQTMLKLIYHRPWETGVPPLKTFSVQISVR